MDEKDTVIQTMTGEEVEEDNIPEVEDVIVINDGRINVKVKNEDGEPIGVFRFNPTDIQMVNRYNESVEKIAGIVKPLEKYDINPDGTGKTEEAMEALNEAEDRMIEVLDYVLGGDSRKAFFTQTHAFSPVNGTFYCGEVFEMLGQYLNMKFDAEIKKVDRRMQKHTHGYRTGKHRKGRS